MFNKKIIVITSILGALLLTSCEQEKKQVAYKPTVEVVPVAKDDVTKTQTLVGQTIAKDKVELMPRVEGFFIKQLAKDGSVVKKGQLLYQIEPTEYQANVQSADAAVKDAEAQVKQAIIDYDRQKYLSTNSAVAKQDFDVAAAKKATAVASLLKAKADLTKAELKYSYTDIKAPFDGQLGACAYSVGDLVGNTTMGTNAAFNRLVMLDPIKVEFYLSEELFVRFLKEHQIKYVDGPENLGKVVDGVYVRLELADGTMYDKKGYVTFFDNVVDPKTGTVMVRTVFRNPDHILIPGSYVKALVESDAKDKVMLIPQVCVMEDQAGKNVLTIDKDKKVKRSRIEVGDLFGDFVEVTSGLNVGELVIKNGIQKVREGMEVNIKEVPNLPSSDLDSGQQQPKKVEPQKKPEVKLIDKAKTEVTSKDKNNKVATKKDGEK